MYDLCFKIIVKFWKVQRDMMFIKWLNSIMTFFLSLLYIDSKQVANNIIFIWENDCKILW